MQSDSDFAYAVGYEGIVDFDDDELLSAALPIDEVPAVKDETLFAYAGDDDFVGGGADGDLDSILPPALALWGSLDEGAALAGPADDAEAAAAEEELILSAAEASGSATGQLPA